MLLFSRFVLANLLVCGTILVCPLSGDAQTVDEFKSAIAELSKNSPAGGPGKNADAAVFVFFRKSNKLCWIADGKIVSVETVSPKVTDDKKEKGPTPIGEYLIGTHYKHEKYKIDWFRLYPRKEDDSGYHSYTSPTKTGRDLMGFHPGSLSEGCVTVKVTTTPYDASDVWKLVRTKLDSGKLTYKKDNFVGLLYVVDK